LKTIILDKLQMKQFIAHIALLVDDYDEAIRFYTEKLQFDLIEDTVLSESKRWVLVEPKGAKECCLLLAKAVGDEQKSRISNQTGGRVFLFLYTDDFWRDYHQMLENGIRFVREPKDEAYGTVAVFEDLYGNLWDLIEAEPKPSSTE
jgi:catechol 2,3-dioxygenase-like lactoylglutathione lyase family enzyme